MHQAQFTSLGCAVRDQWTLDWTKLTVNHGAFGATPRVVLDAQAAWRDRMEAQPSIFMRCVLPDAMRASAAALAAFVKAAPDDVALVDNATTGCNAVMRSLVFEPGDEIVIHGQAYGAIVNTARHVAARTGARLRVVDLPFPDADVPSFAARFAAALDARTKLAIVDHITSPSALLLPVAEIARACRAEGVPLLVDGAHAPGHVSLDLGGLDADWYVGNCHKWLGAPKGCAFLWTRRDRQAGLHPTTISHGYGDGYVAEFDWTGTRDPTAFLALETAIDFHERLGGEALRERNVALAKRAGEILAERLGSAIGNRGHDTAMTMVRLPVGGPYTRQRAVALRARLLAEYGTDAPLHAHPDGIWIRASAQAYNEPADYATLASMCLDLIRTDRSKRSS